MEISMKRNKRTLEDLKNSTLIPVMLVPERIPVSLATVRAWIFQGKLPVIRIGRKVFIRKEVLEKIEMGGFEAVSGEQNICPSPLTILGGDCD
jgi:excisionase family DNA binding protein